MKTEVKAILLTSIILLILLLPKSSTAQIIPYDSELIEANYKKRVEARRVKEEASFRNKETTLLNDAYFENFTGLNYFPIDIKYQIVGKLTRLAESKKMDLELTNGAPYGFMHFGKIEFHLEGKLIELTVFEFPSRSGPKAIFVPFTDQTTGEENFGGGRFMVIKIPKGGQVIIDFNLAINPICVYDPDHACPISPKTNFIDIKILAGAKMYYDPESISN